VARAIWRTRTPPPRDEDGRERDEAALGREASGRAPDDELRAVRRGCSGSRQIGQFWMKRL
jgi:hypothetical protein